MRINQIEYRYIEIILINEKYLKIDFLFIIYKKLIKYSMRYSKKFNMPEWIRCFQQRCKFINLDNFSFQFLVITQSIRPSAIIFDLRGRI